MHSRAARLPRRLRLLGVTIQKRLLRRLRLLGETITDCETPTVGHALPRRDSVLSFRASARNLCVTISAVRLRFTVYCHTIAPVPRDIISIQNREHKMYSSYALDAKATVRMSLIRLWTMCLLCRFKRGALSGYGIVSLSTKAVRSKSDGSLHVN